MKEISKWQGWQDRVREQVRQLIHPEDIADILVAQVAKARKGDARAAKFVFDCIIGPQSLTMVQNNFYSEPAPDPDSGPTAAMAGTGDKIEVIRRRIEKGLPSDHPDDNPLVSLPHTKPATRTKC